MSDDSLDPSHDPDPQPTPAADRGVSSTDPVEGADVPASERAGPAAD